MPPELFSADIRICECCKHVKNNQNNNIFEIFENLFKYNIN